MAVVSGKDASLTINSTTLGSSACLQSHGINDAINEVIYQCGGYDQGVAGTASITATFSAVLSATDTTKLSALAPGTAITTFKYFPFGTTSTYIKYSATSGVITAAPFTSGPNAVGTIDVTVRLNNITRSASTGG